MDGMDKKSRQDEFCYRSINLRGQFLTLHLRQ